MSVLSMLSCCDIYIVHQTRKKREEKRREEKRVCCWSAICNLQPARTVVALLVLIAELCYRLHTKVTLTIRTARSSSLVNLALQPGYIFRGRHRLRSVADDLRCSINVIPSILHASRRKFMVMMMMMMMMMIYICNICYHQLINQSSTCILYRHGM